MRTTATTTGAAKKAKPTRPLGVYVASASDPTAVFKYPDHDWVYLTPEPIHPVAQEHWPYPCRGWRWYVRGHVVSQHAKRIIIQFMAACCGKSTRDNQADADLPECQAQHKELPQTRCL